MIGAAISAALPLLRANAESLMTDRCTIDRQTTTWDEVEQESVTTWTTVYADVPCHVEESIVNARTLVTDERVTAETPVVRIPVAYPGVDPDDRLTVSGGPVLWVTQSAPEDSTHPVEFVVQCRRTR